MYSVGLGMDGVSDRQKRHFFQTIKYHPQIDNQLFFLKKKKCDDFWSPGGKYNRKDSDIRMEKHLASQRLPWMMTLPRAAERRPTVYTGAIRKKVVLPSHSTGSSQPPLLSL